MPARPPCPIPLFSILNFSFWCISIWIHLILSKFHFLFCWWSLCQGVTLECMALRRGPRKAWWIQWIGQSWKVSIRHTSFRKKLGNSCFHPERVTKPLAALDHVWRLEFFSESQDEASFWSQFDMLRRSWFRTVHCPQLAKFRLRTGSHFSSATHWRAHGLQSWWGTQHPAGQEVRVHNGTQEVHSVQFISKIRKRKLQLEFQRILIELAKRFHRNVTHLENS